MKILLSGLNLFKVGWSLNHTEVDHGLVKSVLYKKGGRELFLIRFVWLENCHHHWHWCF